MNDAAVSNRAAYLQLVRHRERRPLSCTAAQAVKMLTANPELNTAISAAHPADISDGEIGRAGPVPCARVQSWHPDRCRHHSREGDCSREVLVVAQQAVKIVDRHAPSETMTMYSRRPSQPCTCEPRVRYWLRLQVVLRTTNDHPTPARRLLNMLPITANRDRLDTCICGMSVMRARKFVVRSQRGECHVFGSASAGAADQVGSCC